MGIALVVLVRHPRPKTANLVLHQTPRRAGPLVSYCVRPPRGKTVTLLRNRVKLIPGLFFAFTLFWGVLAWIDWFFITGQVRRSMEGGILFAPHLILLFFVCCGLTVMIPVIPSGRWWLRLIVASVPGSYVVFRWFG